jgi:hypothetical protein
MEGQHSSCNIIYKCHLYLYQVSLQSPWMWRRYLNVENSKFKGQNSLLNLSWYQLNEILTKIQEKLWTK